MGTLPDLTKADLHNYFKKYVRYSSISILLYAIGVLLAGILLSSVNTSCNKVPGHIYINDIALPASLLLAIGLVLFQTLRIQWYKHRFALLLNSVEQGKGVAFQDSAIEYQFVFGKSSGKNAWIGEWRFFPIQMSTFLLLDNVQTISIPLSEKSKMVLLNFISGDTANKDIEQIWDSRQSAEGISSWDEMERLLTSKFSPQLAAIGKIDLANNSTLQSGCLFWIIALATFSSLGVGVYLWYKANPSLVGEIIGLIAIGAILLYSLLLWIASIFWRKNEVAYHKAERYHKEILTAFISKMNNSFVYREQSFMSKEDILKSLLFAPSKYIIEGDSQLIGKYKNVAFQLCNLYITTPAHTHPKGSREEIEVFNGWCMMVTFNKSFNSRTTVIVKKSWFEILTEEDDFMDTQSYGESVLLEDPEFNKLFKVYSLNQIEARYILTPSLMERIKKINEKHEGVLYLSFTNKHLYIFNNNNSNYLSQNGAYLSSLEEYHQFYNEIEDALQVIDDLQLNIQVWETHETNPKNI
jgi:hypothetical protein